MSKQDRQLRSPAKPRALEKLQPASDMNTRAKGGDKESNEPLRKQLGSSEGRSTTGRKPGR